MGKKLKLKDRSREPYPIVLGPKGQMLDTNERAILGKRLETEMSAGEQDLWIHRNPKWGIKPKIIRRRLK